MIKTESIDHLTLIVKDVKISKKFYQKVCGMKVIFDEEDVCGLTDGTFSLWLALSREKSKKDFNPEETGLNHWAFKVTSMYKLKSIESHLKKLKISMEDGGITNDGYGGTGIFIKDPDGMKVEFHLRK